MNLISVKMFNCLSLKFISCIVIFCLLPLSTTLASNDISPRLKIGKSLLPAIIAANKDLVSFLDKDNSLTVYIVYQDNNILATALENEFSRSTGIQKYSVKYKSISHIELMQNPSVKAAALFLVEPARENLKQIINLSFKTGTILFSPFKGDIERGVATGFQVTDKVLPMVNLTSLRRSRVNLKAFFLRIAVKYEK